MSSRDTYLGDSAEDLSGHEGEQRRLKEHDDGGRWTRNLREMGIEGGERRRRMKGKGKRGKMGKRKLVEMMEYGGETGWTVGVTIWPQHMEANKDKDKEQGTRATVEKKPSIPLWLA
jgi:hypothetical protein